MKSAGAARDVGGGVKAEDLFATGLMRALGITFRETASGCTCWFRRAGWIRARLGLRVASVAGVGIEDQNVVIGEVLAVAEVERRNVADLAERSDLAPAFLAVK